MREPTRCMVCDCPHISWLNDNDGYKSGRCTYCGTVHTNNTYSGKWETQKPGLLGDVDYLRFPQTTVKTVGDVDTRCLPSRVALERESGDEVLAILEVSLDHSGNGHCGYVSDANESLKVPVVDGDIDGAVRDLRDLMRGSDRWAILPG